MNDGFGVGARAITMPFRFQRGTQRFVIVDFTVEGDPDSAVFVGHGIVARGRKIDDGEASIAEPDAAIFGNVDSGVVGSTMAHRIAHARHERLGYSALTHTVFVDSTNSAHSQRSEVRSQKSAFPSRLPVSHNDFDEHL